MPKGDAHNGYDRPAGRSIRAVVADHEVHAGRWDRSVVKSRQPGPGATTHRTEGGGQQPLGGLAPSLMSVSEEVPAGIQPHVRRQLAYAGAVRGEDAGADQIPVHATDTRLPDIPGYLEQRLVDVEGRAMNTDTTIDPTEVAYYERMAEFWWDTRGPFWPLHGLNRLRVAYLRDELCRQFALNRQADRPLTGLRILDVGCGGGILAESMALLGAAVTGIDVVEKNIRIASLHAEQRGLNIDYRLCTAHALANAEERYDVVLNMEVVEHVADLSAFMCDCARLTREGGVMFVATINRTLLSWLFAIVAAEYLLRWLPRGTHRWREFRRPRELSALLARDGFRVQRLTGVAVNPLTRVFRLTGILQVNYMLMAVREAA